MAELVLFCFGLLLADFIIEAAKVADKATDKPGEPQNR
jgi:hypothetical protein